MSSSLSTSQTNKTGFSFVKVTKTLSSNNKKIALNNVKVRAEPETPESKPVSTKMVDRSKDTLFFADEASLTYLDGTLPGDYGFDPLGLLAPGNEIGFINPSWLRYAEVIHCRYAMLGWAGMLAPEALGKLGVIPASTGLVWWKSGVIPPLGTYSEGYWSDSYAIFFINIVLMQFAELRRLQDYRNPGSMGKQYFLGLENFLGGSGDPCYPGGGVFNIFGMGKDEASLKELKTKEIKNGRLAMLAVLGFGAQAVLTGKGPLENLFDHISDPFGNNILTNWANVYGTTF